MRVMIRRRALAPCYQKPGTKWSCIWSLKNMCACERAPVFLLERGALLNGQEVLLRANSSFLHFDCEKLCC